MEEPMVQVPFKFTNGTLRTLELISKVRIKHRSLNHIRFVSIRKLSNEFP